ncbi:formate dehydrogenase subunit delta [Falsigemmobacter intermedius]|uniref:Formate dehydrogenase n=1 Tax=Falsigemmobacter intermedius TaxID=1553448 RepID=A0A444M8J0_9RHOB|nr:formate dehydrogenase subunit delta [Falsigemmobacter intermedius]RWY38772.1 formate dehydrogenase [Falsigemmobacter intermedius]
MSHNGTQEKLVRMANQIAGFMASRPEAEQLEGLSGHINDFWAPSMRRVLLELIASGDENLHPLVRRASALIRPVAAA